MQATPLFSRLWENPFPKITLLRGGSRSSKTYSLCQIFVIWLITGRFGKHHYYPHDRAFIFRKTLPALKRTVLRDFENALFESGYFHKVNYNRTSLTFTYTEEIEGVTNRRSVDLLPADDPQKVKGLDSAIVLLNEADSIDFDAFIQLNIRCRFHIIADYNPSSVDTWPYMVENEWLPKRKDMKLDISTYRDNPFLGETIINEIRQLKTLDYGLYQVYSRGEWARVEGLIFNKYEIIEEMPSEYEREFWGLDFGWKDSSCLVRVLKDGVRLYIDELFYKSEMLNDEISQALYYHKVKTVYADSNQPNTIAELKRLGHIIKGAKKGQDSILQGINKVNQHHLFITARSKNIIDEFKRYKWQTDRNGDLKFPQQPIIAFNHGADAIRYSISDIMRRKISW